MSLFIRVYNPLSGYIYRKNCPEACHQAGSVNSRFPDDEEQERKTEKRGGEEMWGVLAGRGWGKFRAQNEDNQSDNPA